ncbi:MAG: hypothetical protein WD312_02910 [Candidatus Paceibacterota bacterium]
MSFLLFGSYHHAAFGARDKTTERLRFILLFLSRSSALLQYLLRRIKKFLCDDWLVLSFVYFASVAK